MMDVKSVGRLTFLSPVTWKDGWPYFGLEGNLGRSPRTWFKPNVGFETQPHTPYERNDDFSSSTLKPVWQWNHIPDNKKWSIKNGALRIHSQPAKNFMYAKNTLTQRAVGPESDAIVELDAKHLKKGDVAGLAILNVPYYWIGIAKTDKGNMIRFYDLVKNEIVEKPINTNNVYLKIRGDFDNDLAKLSYRLNGKEYITLGSELRLGYQMKTFQGVRYGLFAFNTDNKNGGYAMFDNFKIEEPHSDRSANLPLGKVITFTNMADNSMLWSSPRSLLVKSNKGNKDFAIKSCQFRVHDRGKGRVALEALDGSGFITISGEGFSGDVRTNKNESEEALFMWQDMLRNQCMLLSLKTNKYLGVDSRTGEPYAADYAGCNTTRTNGTVFKWEIVSE